MTPESANAQKAREIERDAFCVEAYEGDLSPEYYKEKLLTLITAALDAKDKELEERVKGLLEFMEVIVEIAQVSLWQSEVGDKKAQELIDEWHEKHFKDHGGIWAHCSKVINQLRKGEGK